MRASDREERRETRRREQLHGFVGEDERWAGQRRAEERRKPENASEVLKKGCDGAQAQQQIAEATTHAHHRPPPSTRTREKAMYLHMHRVATCRPGAIDQSSIVCRVPLTWMD